jgi:hypothetical protein
MVPEDFDLASHLQLVRSGERIRASNLLWENIENNRWGSRPSTLSDTDKLKIQADRSFSTLARFFTVTASTIQSLDDPNVREILLYGASRRISSIRRAVEQILKIAPIDRTKPLSADESHDLSDCLLLLYVHIIGVFDAFAIAMVRKLQPEGVDEKEADLLSKKFRTKLNLPEVEQVFLEHETWLKRVKDELRNRYVHRIPPYIPPARFTKEEGARSQYLEAEKFRLISAGDTDGSEKCRLEQEALGTFLPCIAFSESGALMHLHATVLDDVYRFVCLTYDTLVHVLPILDGKPQEH